MDDRVKNSKAPPYVREMNALIEAGFKIVQVFGIHDGKCRCGDPKCVRDAGKHPPKGVYSATSDLSIIHQWTAGGSNIAATPADSRSIILDVDPRHGARLTDLGEIPPTWKTLSGRGDSGCHLYFRLPEGMEVPNNSPLCRGVDTRAKGGYACIPPSIHATTGAPYVWAGGCAPGDIPLAMLPEHLVERLKRVTVEAPPIDPSTVKKEDVIAALKRIPATGDGDYDRWYRITAALKDTGWEDVFEIWDAWCQTCPEKYNARGILWKWRRTDAVE